MLHTKILIGCYDGSVHGILTSTKYTIPELHASSTSKNKKKKKRKTTENAEDEIVPRFTSKLIFAFSAHETSIKCCAISPSGKFGATGSSDESVQMYDLTRLRVVDKLLGIHESSVSSLAFTPKEGYLLSGDEQGRLIVWEGTRAIHELKGHKRGTPATSIAIHPSSRLALTTSTDNSLRMWDLVNARAAPRKRIQEFAALTCVCWSPDLEGERYALVADERLVLIFDLSSIGEEEGGEGKEDEALVGKFLHPRRVNSLCFIEDVVLVSGCDDGIVRVFGADGSLMRSFAPPPSPSNNEEEGASSRGGGGGANVAAARVREVRCVRSKDGNAHQVIAAYNIGLVRIWDLDDEGEEPVGEFRIGTSAHVTCMSVARVEEVDENSGGVQQRGRKRRGVSE